MNQSSIEVQPRQDTGKQVAKRLRRSGMVPGIYYYHGQRPVPFSVDGKELRNLLAHKSSLIDVNFKGGETSKCVVREVQWDPLSGAPVHIDFMGINIAEKVKVEVPIRLTGAAVGVKTGGGVLQQLLRELEIECLPLDIPEAVTIDVSPLDLHQSVHVGDLKLDKIEILTDSEQVIVSILSPRLEEAPAAPAPGEESKEPEVISQKKKEEEAEEGGKESGKKESGKK
jgi:large subunit ribosomal protein L25